MRTTAPSGWVADAANVAEAERARPGFNFREERVPPFQWPGPLRACDGTRVETATEWERLVRPETLRTFTRDVYGRAPAVPAGVRFETTRVDAHALNGRATHRRITIVIPTARSTAATAPADFQFDFSVFTPNGRAADVPAFLLLNNRPADAADPDRHLRDDFWPVETLIDRGYAAAVFQVGDTQADRPDGLATGLVGAIAVDAPPDERWATIAAWAWAAGRVLDALQAVPGVDAKRVAVIGHSRGGKAALWAGATDPRFGMVIANESGCVGAAPNRRFFGETVDRINHAFPHWFCARFKAFNARVDALPVDQHQLLASIAPRPLYVASADKDLWSDPRGEFLSLAAASKIATLYGGPTLDETDMPPVDRPLICGRLGYHVRSGVHDLTQYDWEQYLTFADRMWPR